MFFKEEKQSTTFKGRRFGNLQAMVFIANSLWACKCDCGSWTLAEKSKLETGLRVSCGCVNGKKDVKQRKHLTREQAAINCIMKEYQQSARVRNIPFDLTVEQFTEIIFLPCFYCAAPPSNKKFVSKTSYRAGRIPLTQNEAVIQHHSGGEKVGVLYNGVDRKNSILGYTVDNTVPCCKTCNRGKNNLTIDEFRAWAEQFVSNFGNW